MNSSQEKIIQKYLSSIGRKGGRKSRRVLDPASAREMVKIREAKKAFRKYFAECFWSCDPEFKISRNDVQWVGKQLMKHGSLECWKIGKRLCQ